MIFSECQLFWVNHKNCIIIWVTNIPSINGEVFPSSIGEDHYLQTAVVLFPDVVGLNMAASSGQQYWSINPTLSSYPSLLPPEQREFPRQATIFACKCLLNVPVVRECCKVPKGSYWWVSQKHTARSSPHILCCHTLYREQIKAWLSS